MLSGNAKSRLLLSAFIITVATVVGNTSYENTFEIEIFGYTFSTIIKVNFFDGKHIAIWSRKKARKILPLSFLHKTLINYI